MKPHVGPQAGVKREETDVSLSSEDNMTVISSHPCAVVDLRVVIWIEVSFHLTGWTGLTRYQNNCEALVVVEKNVPLTFTFASLKTVCDLVEPAADKELRVFSTTTGCWVARKVDEILAVSPRRFSLLVMLHGVEDVGEDELDGELARLYGGVRAYA